MKFDELNAHIPYAVGGKEKSLTMNPYPDIVLAMPGRHAGETWPMGGDFVVMIGAHQFTHNFIFKDLEEKLKEDHESAAQLIEAYFAVIHGEDPNAQYLSITKHSNLGINSKVFLQAVQCLAVAEHRRFARWEAKFGGRYLPFRFAAGIVAGLWTAQDAIDKQKLGRPGVEWLERKHGTPYLTTALMGAVHA